MQNAQDNEGSHSALSFDANLPVNFCIWILNYDGLQVPPFDRHIGGNGILRSQGLTSNDWLTWLQQVVQSHRNMKAIGSELVPSPNYFPDRFWQGEEKMREILARLWIQYATLPNIRPSFPTLVSSPSWNQQNAWQMHQLVIDIRRLRPQAPTLGIYFVDYPEVEYLMPPNDAIIHLGDLQIRTPEFFARVMNIAQKLATTDTTSSD